MFKQLNCDDVLFPVPEGSRKIFHLVQFSQLRMVKGTFILDPIAGQYIEEKQLDMIESISECYYKLFREIINIEITDKTEEI